MLLDSYLSASAPSLPPPNRQIFTKTPTVCRITNQKQKLQTSVFQTQTSIKEIPAMNNYSGVKKKLHDFEAKFPLIVPSVRRSDEGQTMRQDRRHQFFKVQTTRKPPQPLTASFIVSSFCAICFPMFTIRNMQCFLHHGIKLCSTNISRPN